MHGLKEIELANGRKAIIDEEDINLVNKYRWRFDGRYVCSRVDKNNPNKLYLHRIIMDAQRGDLIDHANGDKLDNRKSNLRKATHQENAANCRLHAHNSTGYKGVYRYSRGNKRWRAAITFRDKQISLGYYDNPVDAAMAYNKKALELYGEFAKINIIREAK